MSINTEQTSQQRKKVIIVDDDVDLLKLLLYAFDSEGFETKGIETGKEAIEYLANDENTKSACLLVLDRVLPDMDGLFILKQLPDSLRKRLPVLILSVLSAERDVLSGLRQGAVDYIPKPFNLPILMEKALHLTGRPS
jgi:DNA-binding response OmpR family regulator